jgi:hypothetical protein
LEVLILQEVIATRVQKIDKKPYLTCLWHSYKEYGKSGVLYVGEMKQILFASRRNTGLTAGTHLSQIVSAAGFQIDVFQKDASLAVVLLEDSSSDLKRMLI